MLMMVQVAQILIILMKDNIKVNLMKMLKIMLK